MAYKDAAAVAQLRQAGATIIGKTNLHEFAFGTTSEDSAFGPVRNPYDPTHSPGGSSGGSVVVTGGASVDDGGAAVVVVAAGRVVGGTASGSVVGGRVVVGAVVCGATVVIATVENVVADVCSGPREHAVNTARTSGTAAARSMVISRR
jgi:mandelamide amidase